MRTGFEIFKSRLFPIVKRNIHQFSEEEVVLPKGPRRGMPFSLDYMPFNRFIFDALHDDRWKRIAVVGPTQNGKSLVCTNIPLLYYLFEEEEDVIFGIPQMDLAAGMYREKIYPVIANSAYRDQLPTAGAGARGGVPTAIQFKNGTVLRFMGAGGGDEQRSSHTAKIIIISEVDKMDTAATTSDEADPVHQILMRADAYQNSKAIMECTVTTQYGRIWQETMVQGSAGQIHVPCTRCNEFQRLIREQLKFETTDAISAEESAYYECQYCGKHWNDMERLQALDSPLLVHKGQSVKNNEVVGELPRTRTFGLHYNVLYSPMQSLGKTAAQQFEADQSELDSSKKAMSQSKWSLPPKDDQEVKELTHNYLYKKMLASRVRLREVPFWTENLIATVDIQHYYLYYHIEAYDYENRSQVIDYGTHEFVSDTDQSRQIAFSEINRMCDEGWARINEDGSETLFTPAIRLIDIGYTPDAIIPWLLKSRNWFGIRGIGKGTKGTSGTKTLFDMPGIFQAKFQRNGLIYWFIDTDTTKSLVHDRHLLKDESLPGYTWLPKDVHRGYTTSLVAERREFEPMGDGFKWIRVKKRNDYLDCRSYGVAANAYLIYKHKRDQIKHEGLIKSNLQKNKHSMKKENWFNSTGRFFDG